jgi:hypothetical protein
MQRVGDLLMDITEKRWLIHEYSWFVLAGFLFQYLSGLIQSGIPFLTNHEKKGRPSLATKKNFKKGWVSLKMMIESNAV